MIIQRYILRLILVPFLFISLLITVLLLAEAFGDVVTRALGGTLPGSAVLLIIAYQVPPVLEELIPGAFFLSAVLALGQLSASSERVVLQAVGYSDNRILGLVLVVAVLVSGLLFFITLVLAPWSGRQVDELESRLAERPAAELVQPGEFAQISSDGATLYARGTDSATGELLTVFLAYFEGDAQQLATAERAQVINRNGIRYLRLTEGELLEEDGQELEKTQFGTMEIRLDTQSTSTTLSRRSKTFSELWDSTSGRDRTEAQQRLLYPLTIFVFAFWAVSMTRYSPRSGKNAAVLPAVIFYVLYNYLMRTINISVRGDEGLPFWANYWWLHLIAIALALMIRADWTRWRNRLMDRMSSREADPPREVQS